MILRDPSTNKGMGVDSGGYGKVFAITEREARHANIAHEEAYAVVIASDPSAGDADFFYLKNNSDDDLIIYKIKGWLASGAAGVVEVTIKGNVSGTPGTPTTLTPANLTVGSGHVADVTCYQRDGDMALTGGTTLDVIRLDNTAGIGEQIFEYHEGIRLKKNGTLIFNNDIDPVGVDIDMTVYFYFRPHEETT